MLVPWLTVFYLFYRSLHRVPCIVKNFIISIHCYSTISTSDVRVEGRQVASPFYLFDHPLLSTSLHNQFSALHSKSPCRTSLDDRIEGRVTRKALSRNYANTCSIIRTTSTPSADELYNTHPSSHNTHYIHTRFRFGTATVTHSSTTNAFYRPSLRRQTCLQTAVEEGMEPTTIQLVLHHPMLPHLILPADRMQKPIAA